MKVGEVFKWDFQSDVFCGEYRLVKDLGKGSWLVEYLEPSDALIAEASAYYLTADPESSAAMGYHDPFGPERRLRTPQEALDAEILERIDRAGDTTMVKFVSAQKWAEAF